MISDELMRKAGKAWADGVSAGVPPSIERGLRAAIEAVAPAIRAEALEDAARVAEAKAVSYLEQAGYDMSGRPFRRVAQQEDVETHNSWVSKANAAGSIRAAIRAMKER
jgi:hypothetical protein